ncbi:MAG: glycosyltransferase [Chitinophagales bacterium]
MLRNILFISYDGMCDPLGQSQVIPYLTGLSALGHRITIVSAEKPEAYRILSAEISNQLSGSQISWQPVCFSHGLPGWSAWENFWRLKSEARKACIKSTIDIVHCRSYISALIGLQLKNRFHLKMIFDMRGFWADERVEGGLWNLRNPLYRFAYHFFKKKEKQFLLSSEAIVCLTESAREVLLSWKKLQLPADHIFVIPCCADLHLFTPKNPDPEKKAGLRKQLNIQKNDFILSYSGSLGTWYLLNEMLEFFSMVLSKKPEAKFLFITHDIKEPIIASAAIFKIPPERIIVTGATRRQMPVMLSLSDISIFFIKNSFSKTASSPTKMAEVMAMGIPVICNAGVGDVETIISKTGTGICIPELTTENFASAISRLDSLLRIPPDKISDSARQYFSLDVGIEKYNSIYQLL